MKRKKDPYPRIDWFFALFGYVECDVCDQEFWLERGWQCLNTRQRACQDCCPTKESAAKALRVELPASPPAPPPAPPNEP